MDGLYNKFEYNLFLLSILEFQQMIHRIVFISSFFILLSSCSTSFSEIFPYELAPKQSLFPKPEHINILSSKGLKLSNSKGKKVSELSGISWDQDENILYAVSDEGILYHLALGIESDEIHTVKVIATYPLLNRKNKPFKKKWKDSEGLSTLHHDNAISGDTELIVSFEGKPRVVRFTPQGKYISEVKLPTKLWRKKNYRNKNKALESVTIHPSLGIITAAEFPLKGKKKTNQTLYAASGKSWDFTAASAKNSAVTGLEVLPNGNIMVLERAWAGVNNPVVITLAEIPIENCKSKLLCNAKELASLSSAEGWTLDNFEGLAHYQGNQYLMISDDNDKKFQTMVLVLFEVNLNP
jgi:hypothetical protein